MAFENTIHGGAAPSMTTSVYYTGSDTLLEGYAVCYDFNAADVNQENVAQTSPNVGEEVWADARRVLVEKPTEGNKIHFAGIVAANSDNVTGPGWITIHRPGSICNVYAASDADHEESAGSASGQLLNVTVGSYAMTDGGFPGCGAALVLQDVDRSSTNGLVMAELMTGAPSGGYCAVPSAAATDSMSDILSMVPVYCGEYVIGEGSAAASPTIISSLGPLAADGNWNGQKMQIKAGTDIVSACLSMTMSTIGKAQYSTYAGAVGSAIVDLSVAAEYVNMEFDGVRWMILGGHEGIVT